MPIITQKDKDILRALAHKQYEYSQTDSMKQLRRDWTAHNDCRPGRPMITVELETFQQDVIPPLLQCTGETARAIEARLYSNIVNHELFKDDSIVRDHMALRHHTTFTPFGIPVQVKRLSDSLGHHFEEVLSDLQEDFHLLGPSVFSVNMEGMRRELELYHDLFDGILPVRVAGGGLYAVPTQNIIHIMSMENMMFAMYDYPEEFHAMMARLTDDYLAYFKFMEQEGLLLPTTGDEPLGQGTYCFTDELPGAPACEGRPLSTKDVWGFMDSQETAGVSPEMYETFIFPYYKKISDTFGLLSYGCCEAVDPIWERCLSKLDNLRKVSISPWCNEDYMGEQLRGRPIVYHRKPSPNFLGVGSVLDEDGLRAHIRKTVHAARGCTLEITQRDVYTLGNTYEKVVRYVEIVREECEKFQ